MDKTKQKIIELFNEKVKGRKVDTSHSNQAHDGKDGHWLETQMGITHNGDNAPDLWGYEMKNQTSSGKITFGDWTADEYIFLHGRGKDKTNSINKEYQISRDEFLKIFGKPNTLKNNRLSWSGTPCPTYYGDITPFGQHLTMDSNSNVIITYNFSDDTRENKENIVPLNMRNKTIILAKWKYETLKQRVEKKFNQKGWFTCKKNSLGEYDKIEFANPIDYNFWIECFKNKIVFFDSGMYEGNKRPYSQWRASTSFWHSLITDSH